MNKAVMITIQPKWAEMIKDGTKTFEFRNYAIPKGTKVYLYESLGKRIKGYCLGDCEECVNAIWDCNGWEQDEADINGCKRKLTPYHPDMGNLYEGTGKVIGEFVVKDLYEIGVADRPFYDKTKLRSWSKYEVLDDEYCKKMGWEKEGFFTWMPIEVKTLQVQGYTNQKYAHEITDLIWYEKPLDISEFVGWNKYNKPFDLRTLKKGEIINAIQFKNRCKLTHPFQGKIYVVEKGE